MSGRSRFLTAAFWRLPVRLLFVALFAFAGIYHFKSPDSFIRAMPDWIPRHAELVALTGIMEIAGAIGLLVKPVRQLTARCLSVFLLCVFVVNINMALHPEIFPNLSPWLLWLRLPFQFVFIAGVIWSARD